MKHRTLALLLALVLCFSLLAGCGSSSSDTEEATTEAEETEEAAEEAEEETEAAEEAAEEETAEEETTEAAAEEAAAEESAEEETEEAEEAVSITYPIEGEMVTLTMFNTFKAPFDEIMHSDDFPNIEYLEEQTNVHIEWMDLTMDTADEQFNLLCAADDLPDMISNGISYYNGSIEQTIEDEVFLRLNDLLPEYAPDYWALLTADESMVRDASDDSGNMVSVYAIKDTYVAVNGGYVIRQDYLDALGLDVPVTYDEFTEVLEAIVVAYDPECAFAITSDNYTGLLTAGFGVSGEGFYQVDGVVMNTFVSDGYRSYVELMVDWYDKGIISHDFLSYSSDPMASDNKARIYTGDNVIFSTQAEEFYTLAEAADDPNFSLTAINEPVENEGDITHFTDVSTLGSSNTMEISANCEYPEIALMWLNYFYTDVGSDVGNFGIPGETFDYDEDGNPYFLDSFVNNEEGYALNRIAAAWSGYGKWPMYNQETRLFQILDDAQLEAYEVWHSGADGAYLMSSVTLTTEESDQITSKYNDIETYVDENIAKFIVGDKSMDEFDDFVETLYDMGIQECIDVYQQAYDRYLER